MFADVRALCYLEYRQIVNRLRAAVRSPGRLVMYVLAIAYFGTVVVWRSHRLSPAPMRFYEPYAGATMFAYVALIGILAYGAASGIVGAFSSAADARFLTGCAIGERTVAMWLQLRRSAGNIGRMIFTVLFYAVLFSRSATFAAIAWVTLGATLIATAPAIPMLKLRQAAGNATAQTFALVMTAIGVVPMLLLLSGLPAPSKAAAGIAHLGAGAALNELLAGNRIALGALYAFAVVLAGLAYAAGTDLYPELYAASLRALAFRAKRQRGAGAAFTVNHKYEVRSRHGASSRVLSGLNGPWTIAWKEWVGFARSPGARRALYAGLTFCGALGALAGTIAARSRDPLSAGISIAAVAANMIVVIVAMGSAVALGADLQKPLWWMGPDPLFMRLLAWVVSTSWRLSACLCAGVLGWAIAAQNAGIAFAGIPLAIVTVLYLRAIGLALYALFPASIDQRGPLAMFRALLTYLLAAPPAIAGIVVLALVHSTGAAVAAAVTPALVETLLLVAFAALRIAGNGAAFARAEGASASVRAGTIFYRSLSTPGRSLAFRNE